MFEAIIVIVFLSLGVVLGYQLSLRALRRVVRAARQRQQRLLDDTRQHADLARREAEAQTRERLSVFQRELEEEQQELAGEIQALGALLDKKQDRLEQRADLVEHKASRIEERLQVVRQQRQEARSLRQTAKETRRSYRQVTEERAGVTGEAVRRQLVERMIEETRSHCADRLRNLESNGSEAFDRQAKRVMGITIQRYTGHCVRDRASMNMALGEGEAEKLQREAGEALAALEEITGLHLSFADDGSSVRLESGDGVAREVARRALARFISEAKIRDARRLIESTRVEVEREIDKAGKEALRHVRLAEADPEIVALLGKLNYRTSYTQNQWRHAIEAGHLAGLMAAELGLDPEIARRGALLHDIGKALTHEVEGSHALIGAEIARRTGEDERVANAVAYHHGEEPSASAYAPLVAAADAMSGGRPGARREMVEAYSDRIGDLEKIASGFDGVASVHAIQAGRELRVHVDDRRISDEQLAELSTRIAQRISDEMVFPGQIRVTVIREFSAVEIAN